MPGTPSLQKNWQFVKDYSSCLDNGGSLANMGARIIVAMKDMFKSMGWTVKGSCDGSTAAMDAVDRWDDVTDLVANSSWLVVKHTGFQFEVLFHADPSSFGAERVTFYTSWTHSGGFTGGTTSARPTAPDERIENYTSSQVVLSGAENHDHYVVGMRSTDDTSHRLVVFSAADGNPTVGWLFEKPSGAPASSSPHEWPGSIYALFGTRNDNGECTNILNDIHIGFAIGDEQPWYSRHYDGSDYSNWRVRMSGFGVIINGAFREVAANSIDASLNPSDITTQPDPVTGDYLLCPVWWWGQYDATSPARPGAPLGIAVDLWRGPMAFCSNGAGSTPATLPQGAYIDSLGTRKLIQSGIVVFPWDGSVAPWETTYDTASAVDIFPSGGGAVIGGAPSLKKFNPGLDEVS